VSIGLEDQRRRANRWRATVALVLQAAGFPAESRPAARRISEEAFTFEPDVNGVPGLHIVASPVAWARVSTYLTKAVGDADERGQGDVPVLVLPRQQHEPASAYAILLLSDLARLAQDAHRGRSEAAEG
jgi:hypothetical protein